MRRHHTHHQNIHRRPTNGRSANHQPLVLSCLIVAAAICFLAVGMVGGEVGSVSAQISPLSPLGVQAVTGGASLSLTQLPLINVLASGQAGLTRLALLLLGIIVGVSVIIWRQP